MAGTGKSNLVPVDVVEAATRLLVCGCCDLTVAAELAIELADAKAHASGNPVKLGLLLVVHSFEIKLQVDN